MWVVSIKFNYAVAVCGGQNLLGAGNRGRRVFLITICTEKDEIL